MDKFTNANISKLSNDKKFGFNGDNEDMQQLKKRINIVQGMLRGDLTPYMDEKGNLPLLHKDIDGFLNRRRSQLKKSRENKKTFAPGMYSLNEEDEHKEELRMEKAHADEQDYKNGIEFIELLQKKISGAGVNEKSDVQKRCAGYFRHDFEK